MPTRIVAVIREELKLDGTAGFHAYRYLHSGCREITVERFCSLAVLKASFL